MYYLFLLYSKSTGKVFVGATADLKKRFYYHNVGKSTYTKSGVPWQLVYYEAYSTKEDALNRERKLKQYGQALRRLKERISLVVQD